MLSMMLSLSRLPAADGIKAFNEKGQRCIMYINEVIRLARKYYPSEYDEQEMYIWCNEVSSMLAVEDRTVMKEITISTASDGSLLLPESVAFENVYAIYDGTKRLEKTDLREHMTDTAKCGREYRIVYEESFSPIRTPRYRGSIAIDSVKGTFTIYEGGFKRGDTVSITLLSSSGSEELKINKALIVDSKFTTGGFCYCVISPDGSFEALDITEHQDAVVERIVTDRTVCEAPFDGMYVDYLLAKINMYQRDIDAYNQHMTAFNSRLAAYRKWLATHLPNGEGKLINWW